MTLVYRIKIDVENPRHELKPGMPADAHRFDLGASPCSSGTQSWMPNDSASFADLVKATSRDVRAVDELSFEVAPGEIFGLVGPDGAGKTTTMRMLAGVMRAGCRHDTIARCDVSRDPEGGEALRSAICRSALAYTKI